jgi:hypothetical protein
MEKFEIVFQNPVLRYRFIRACLVIINIGWITQPSWKKNLPIGSGVTEATCKTLVKQRLWGNIE